MEVIASDVTETFNPHYATLQLPNQKQFRSGSSEAVNQKAAAN